MSTSSRRWWSKSKDPFRDPGARLRGFIFRESLARPNPSKSDPGWIELFPLRAELTIVPQNQLALLTLGNPGRTKVFNLFQPCADNSPSFPLSYGQLSGKPARSLSAPPSILAAMSACSLVWVEPEFWLFVFKRCAGIFSSQLPQHRFRGTPCVLCDRQTPSASGRTCEGRLCRD